jgi:hypothetical protein
MNNPQVVSILPLLHVTCAVAEWHLESHWAAIIIGADSALENEDSGLDLALFLLNAHLIM